MARQTKAERAEREERERDYQFLEMRRQAMFEQEQMAENKRIDAINSRSETEKEIIEKLDIIIDRLGTQRW